MKTKFPILAAAICAFIGAPVRSADTAAKSGGSSGSTSSSTTQATAATVPPGGHKPAVTKPAKPTLPPKLAAEKATEEAIRAHIKPAKSFEMPTPPPAPRTETKPPAPAENLVWVPGHWAPQDGQWNWVAGQWSVPATPVSVWIEAKYDPAAKRWDAGYWQPDRPDSYEGEAPAKETATDVK